MAQLTGDKGYVGSVRGSISNNAAAYGFSVMITSSFGMLTTLLGSPQVWEVFLFMAGASGGFIGLEVATTRGLSRESGPERPDVVQFGAALSLASVSGGVGAATLVGELVETSAAWPAAAFAATCAYILLGGVEMLVGRLAEE